jgi:heat-inducible transcriptional repressor
MLSQRGGAILRSIVEQYINRALPVPSQNLINDRDLAVSSATIRNEMILLEQEGYIIRPHPSAGSVPSDKGYRFYVEALQAVPLPSTQQLRISHLFHQVESELEEWLSLAATLTSQLVQNMAVVAVPKPANCRLKHLEVVVLQDALALVVVVLHGARLRQQLMTFDRVVPQPELSALADHLNTIYGGLTRQQITDTKTELSVTEQQVDDCLIRMMEAEDEQEQEKAYLDGLHFTFNQPEFRLTPQVLALTELVDCRRLLVAITPGEMNDRRVQVVIGKENRAEAIQNCSVVITRYGLPEEAEGIIAVIGPKRMPYARTISTVSYLAAVLSHLMAELYGKKPQDYESTN